MTARVLDGSKLAAEIREALAARVSAAVASGKRAPCVALVVVGDDPGSHAYVSLKDKMATKVGIVSRRVTLAADSSVEMVERALDDLASDPGVDGVLLQLPLPAGLPTDRLLERIPVDKDIDGLTIGSQGKMALGRMGLRPCTPMGIARLIESSGVAISGARVAVVGQSALVGASVSTMLRQAGATVIAIRSTETKACELTRLCDIVVVATGCRGLVGREWIKPGAIVIDVGNNRDADGKVHGDVRHDEVVDIAGAITPVPGGVGPMTIACLLSNVVDAYERSTR